MRLQLLFLLIFSMDIIAQEFPGKVYNTSLPNGTVQVWCENNAYNPITVELSGRLTNMDAEVELPAILVVPPNTKKFHLTNFVPQKNRSWKYDFGSKLFHGDLNLTSNYSSTYIYRLPVETGKDYFISQGYNGTLSHRGENALDFDMPIGAPVFAARAGVVTKVIDNNHRSCPQESCNQYNNIVVLYHEDGSFAEYVHLAQNSAKVQPGEYVEAGQQLAASGNTGWTTGPHLHFSVYVPTKDGKRTVETQFSIRENHPTHLKLGDRL